MPDFSTADSPERRRPLSARKNGVLRDEARKARQAERRHNHEQERMMTRQVNEGRYDQGQD